VIGFSFGFGNKYQIFKKIINNTDGLFLAGDTGNFPVCVLSTTVPAPITMDKIYVYLGTVKRICVRV
jgi:hypothetical protein